ncbi:MAG TPA: D-sedoheptulose 7-phosphate isomerase [Cytophagaceae bacterium]|jgi:D-sedoheptulose 7-phosphate isomerase|nr:D-sedoheptulose 7-phosphate isomerase [Cytophagaceae bacterium]
MNTSDLIYQELTEASELLQKFLSNKENITAIERAAKTIVSSLKKGGIIISCGNGGSACDAMHFAEELSGKFRENRDPIPAMAISDPGYLTCTANDFGYGHVFSRYVKGFGNKGDILVAISTSGDSENVVKAAEAARQKQMKVIGLTGKNGGKLAELCDVQINVLHTGYADRIQEIHIKIIHILIFLIEKQLNTDVS